MHTRQTRRLLAALLLVIVPISVYAQGGVATLAGRVTDPQGNGITGASVTVTDPGTGNTWTAATAADGRFSVPMIRPGLVDVDITRAGLAPWRAAGLTLQVGQTRVLDVRMALAGVQERLDVSEVARTGETGAGGVLTAEDIASLPLNGRNFLELALLVPGTVPAPTFDPTKTNSVLLSSAGGLGRGGNIVIDGQDNNDDVVGGPLLNLPIDAVQEFQSATNGFTAELGRSATSVLNVVTRSGTNALRGSASLFARDDAWQAKAATLDDDTEASPFDRQQVSGAVGGPLLPGRLFFFGAAEVRNQDGAVLVGTRNTTARRIDRSYAPAPLDDRLWLARIDSGGSANRFTVRYAGEHATDTAASALERVIGSATQRQHAANRYQSVLGTWTFAGTPGLVTTVRGGVSTFLNRTVPLATMPQFTFPSLQDGASFRMPQETTQRRWEVSSHTALVRGAHTFGFGGTVQRVDGQFILGVFREGRVEVEQDFPAFDANGDGQVNDNDILFSVSLRSGKPDEDLTIPDADNVHLAGFVQDDWRVTDRLQLSLGLRYEFDTNVNNQSGVDDLNPLVAPFVTGERKRDTNNFGPRVGFAWSLDEGGDTVLRGGYGLHYDRVVLQIISLERGLDGRALPIEVRAGNVFFLDDNTGALAPGAPTLANPFSGFVLPGAGASGIFLIEPRLQHPMVHQLHLGLETAVRATRLRADGVYNAGRNLLIGRTVGEVFNPVVDGPDRVSQLESSAESEYSALLLSAERRVAGVSMTAGYTLSKAFSYANDDQIPFLNGPIDPDDLRREFGPAPNDHRHRFTATAYTTLAGDVRVAGIWTASSGVPMDIMMPDGETRVPILQRNAGGRLFRDARELNAFITGLNAAGGVAGVPLPLVSEDARFTDSFSSVDLRISRPTSIGGRVRIEPMLEVFNLFNTANILGTTNVSYSGYANVLVRDSNDPNESGFLRSSSFGRPVTTAGGVFGSGGPRAMQLSARVSF